MIEGARNLNVYCNVCLDTCPHIHRDTAETIILTQNEDDKPIFSKIYHNHLMGMYVWSTLHGTTTHYVATNL